MIDMVFMIAMVYICFYMNIFIYTQLQNKKVQSPDIIYLVFPGVK